MVDFLLPVWGWLLLHEWCIFNGWENESTAWQDVAFGIRGEENAFESNAIHLTFVVSVPSAFKWWSRHILMCDECTLINVNVPSLQYISKCHICKSHFYEPFARLCTVLPNIQPVWIENRSYFFKSGHFYVILFSKCQSLYYFLEQKLQYIHVNERNFINVQDHKI